MTNETTQGYYERQKYWLAVILLALGIYAIIEDYLF
jgi:uncharacterized membrane protein YhaH (DUF805 family)